MDSLRRMLKRLLFSYFLVIGILLFAFRQPLGLERANPLWAAGVVLFISFCVILVTRYFYVRPLIIMNDMTDRIKKGDFSRRINLTFHNELGDLARNLNEMSEVLQNQIRTITTDKNELQAILSSLIEGVIVIGADGQVLYVSPNFSDLLDVRSRQTKGRPYWEVLRNQEINDTIGLAITNRRAVRKELVVGLQESCFSMQVSPVVSDQGDLMSVAAIFHDITELKRFERMRTEFVANVSHELKTPLTSIKGFVETLQSGAFKEPETTRRFLEIISKHTDRLENLVNDLLTLSSLESQERIMEFSEEPVGQIIESVLALSRSQVDKGGHQLTVDIQPNLPPVRVDRRRMEQVFVNLLDNAVKFTPAGGSVRIRACLDNGMVRVDVADTGIGIDTDHIPRLFERFYRVDRARSRELGGTGLGLAIVKHIMIAHGGRIAVTSKLHEGSVFSVYIPRA